MVILTLHYTVVYSSNNTFFYYLMFESCHFVRNGCLRNQLVLIQHFSQDYDLVSYTTHVVCFIFIHEWLDQQFQFDTFLWLQFYLILEFFPDVCWEEITEKNIFSPLFYSNSLSWRLNYELECSNGINVPRGTSSIFFIHIGHEHQQFLLKKGFKIQSVVCQVLVK